MTFFYISWLKQPKKATILYDMLKFMKSGQIEQQLCVIPELIRLRGSAVILKTAEITQ